MNKMGASKTCSRATKQPLGLATCDYYSKLMSHCNVVVQ